jgi:hypothetical protein
MKYLVRRRIGVRGRDTVLAGSLLVVALVASLVVQARTSTTRLGDIRLVSDGGNAVTYWATVTENAIITAKKFPGITYVYWAISQAAVYDAAIAIDGGYEPYATRIHAVAGTSSDAAVATAAHDALVGMFPDQEASLDSTYASYMATIPRGTSRVQGVRVGHKAAEGILELRTNDGRDAVVPWVQPTPGPGVYEPTGAPPPLGTNMPFITPFMLRSASQFRPAGPDPLESAAYTRDFNEVKELGSATNTSRTPEQTEIALFWTDPPIQWGRALNLLATSRGMGNAQTARMIVMAVMTAADGLIACFDAKYHYLFWRPTHAIQRADTDGNPDTVGDPSWTPLVLPTPNHPEYPSAHGCASGGLLHALAVFFGTDQVSFSVDSVVTHTTHYYDSFEEVVPEIANARVWGGVHFRHATEDGFQIGSNVASWMSTRFFQRA